MSSTLLIEAPTQVFSCEYCEIFKNTFFKEQLWTTTSAYNTAYNLFFPAKAT